MGLITRVVLAGNWTKRWRRSLQSLAAKSPIGIKIGKEAFHASEGMSLERPWIPSPGSSGRGLDRRRPGGPFTAFLEKRVAEIHGEIVKIPPRNLEQFTTFCEVRLRRYYQIMRNSEYVNSIRIMNYSLIWGKSPMLR